MSLSIQQKDNLCHLSFQGEMTIYDVTELKSQMITAIPDQGEVEIDLSQVSEFDTAGLQLLIGLQQSCLRNGQSFSLSGSSPCVVELLKLFSFTFDSED